MFIYNILEGSKGELAITFQINFFSCNVYTMLRNNYESCTHFSALGRESGV